MDIDNTFIPLKGDYRKLVAFQKAECIYDITYYFIQNKATAQFLETGGIREQMTKARINYRNKKD